MTSGKVASPKSEKLKRPRRPAKLTVMSTVLEIEEAIERLPQQDLFALADWISQRFESAWDHQIEEDVKAGRLDKLAEEALAEYRAGKCTPFPPDAE